MNGKINPRIVRTKYETEDVVIASVIPTEDGYAVDPTGKDDSTEGIQQALDDCYRNGGGTVFLPEGTYSVSGTVSIPPHTALRGDWQDPDTGNGYGTVISVSTENWVPKDENAPYNEGTFLLGGSAGVYGLTVYYPEQNEKNPRPYAPAFYTNGFGNSYMASFVKNCTVLNGWLGIGACCHDLGAHEQLTVENFKGTFLYTGAEVYNQADVGTWQNVVISSRYWKNVPAERMRKPDGEALDRYLRENAVGLTLGDLEWTEFCHLVIEGYHTGIRICKGKRIAFAGSICDAEISGCEYGMKIEDLDDRWGLVLASSVIEGKLENATEGRVKCIGTALSGEITGDVTQDGTQTSEYRTDFTRSYRKPEAKLFIADLPEGGEEDVSAALQKELDEAGKEGGVVYIKGGCYRLDAPVSVPAGVELRGTAAFVNRCQGGDSGGTVFLCYYGDEEESRPEDTALITLAGKNAGLNGIRILYPENGPAEQNLNTTYTVRGKAEGVYFVNGEISASANGVDFSGCDNHFLKKLSTCCYKRTFLVGGKNGQISGCLQNGTVLVRCGLNVLKNRISEGEIFERLFNPITRRTNTAITVKDAENEQIFNTFVYGCETLLENENSVGTLAVNIGSDNIGGVQTVQKSGELTVINAMRYNGTSYLHIGGKLTLFNRLTIWDKNEETYRKA